MLFVFITTIWIIIINYVIDVISCRLDIVSKFYKVDDGLLWHCMVIAALVFSFA